MTTLLLTALQQARSGEGGVGEECLSH